MRRYETVWVVNGDLPDDEVKATVDKFTRIIAGHGGMIVSVDEWGRRKLAYKIKTSTRGYYVLADFASAPETVKELERNYRIDDRVMRYLTTIKSDKVNLQALQDEIASKAQAAADKAAAAAAAAAPAPAAPEAAPVAAPEPAAETAPEPAVAEAAATQEEPGAEAQAKEVE
jgi:small subunit ribosomal protein S6